MDNTVLEVKNLVKKFKTKTGEFNAVADISFSVKEGEIVGLLGPNGAGKTTTINILLGLISPTKGEIRIFNKDLTKDKGEILQQMNFSSAYISLPWRLTVSENLYTYALLYDVKNPKERITQCLEIFKVTNLKNKTIEELSSGQKTRVMLAKAFINSPRLVLLDEPTASLDPDVAVEVRDFLKKIRQEQKVTMLFTSHNMAEVEEVCDRVIFINHGKIIAQDTPVGLASRITQAKVCLMITDGMKRTIKYCENNSFQHSQDGRYITITIKEQNIASFLTTLAGEGITYQEISINKPTLEDYFIQKVHE